ncbi:MAG: hypothetical protein QOG09_1370 [Solirubrobacterales bacterium]|nr:hypothetical protein [Solirubrobacterales bacterium]
MSDELSTNGQRRTGLVFCERIAVAAEAHEDLLAARLVTRIQAGATAAFSELYETYFDRVYAYLRVALRDHHEAEDAAQQVFMQAMEALPRYQLRRGTPFRAWLFRIARNAVIAHARKHSRIDVEDPAELDQRRENGIEQADSIALDWISDSDLMLFIDRLPDAQRQALVLRFVLGLTTEEIAALLERTPVAVRKLEHRALRFLEARLAAIGRSGHRSQRVPTLVRMRRVPVLRARRFALGVPGAGRSGAALARRR